MINIYDINNYKKCREKQYKAYFCLPDRESYVINKLEKTDEYIKLGKRAYINKDTMYKLKVSNINMYKFITENGKKVDNNHFVLSGVVNNLDIITFNELVNQFVYSDGTQITKESILKLMAKTNYFDWVAIVSKRTLSALACHIENKYVDKLNINGRIYSVNVPGIDHGKGDFAVCYTDISGRPLLNTLRIYNGIEFKERFDNRGWQSNLSTRNVQIEMPDSIVRHLAVGNSINKVDDFKGSQLAQIIEQILAWCKKTIHPDIKWEYKRVTNNKFSVASSVVENYKKVNNCTHTVSSIEIKDTKIEFKVYNANGSIRNKAFEFELGIDNYITDKLVEDRAIYFGLLGYVRGDIPSLFRVEGQLKKDEYDGLERYTVSSSGMNRVCRGMDKESEKLGEIRADIIRSILQVDRALEKSKIANEMSLFRGMPLDIAYQFGNCNESNFDKATIHNTAFTSSSLNIQSTIMFALPRNCKEGLIQIIDNNIGVNAMYINDIAGWEEQYEVLVDRCYDIQNDRFMFELKAGGGSIIKVVKSHFVMHRALSKIDMKDLNNHGIYNYDESGRIGLYKELFDNEIHEIFDILREKGLTNLQYIEKTVLEGLDAMNTIPSSYIIIDAGEQGNGKGIDLLYSLDCVGNRKILSIYEVCGDRNELRNYWSDINRKEGKTDYNYRWSAYNHKRINIGDINLDNIDYIEIAPNLSLEEIAENIYQNIVYRKNVVAFPLLDIARYFGQAFQQYIVQEGYVIKQSFRIDRIGKEEDPQDGYVPIKFRIDGDNDDDLFLQIIFKRDKNNDLSIGYRGQAASKKVNESKTFVYNTFNTEVANKVAEHILYTFAKKLELSCVSKIDRFLESFCIRNRFNNIRVQQNAEKDKNGSHCKKYRIIREQEVYNMLGVKFLGGEFKLMVSNKLAKEMMVFNYQSSMKEIDKIFKMLLKKLKDESEVHELINMEV